MTVAAEAGSMSIDIWPQRVHLSPSQRRQVLGRLSEHDDRCPSCGRQEFELGDPLAAVALHDRGDAYRVMVKCAASPCASSPWSVRLHAREFLHVTGR